jgi:hypothetical protein
MLTSHADSRHIHYPRKTAMCAFHATASVPKLKRLNSEALAAQYSLTMLSFVSAPAHL